MRSKAKLLLLVAIICYSCGIFARETIVGAQAVSQYFDSEVSTNISFNAKRKDTKNLEVRLAFGDSIENSVQIAFGRDANGNGNLEPEETAFMFGRRRGEHFVEDVAGGKRYVAQCDSLNPETNFLDMEVSTDRSLKPRNIKFTCERGECFADIGALPISFDSNWNLVKVTRRGRGMANELCSINNQHRAMMLFFR